MKTKAAAAPALVRPNWKNRVFRSVAPPIEIHIGYLRKIRVYLCNLSLVSQIMVVGKGNLSPNSATPLAVPDPAAKNLVQTTLIFEGVAYECVVTETEVTLTRLPASAAVVPASTAFLGRWPTCCTGSCCAEAAVPIRVIEPVVTAKTPRRSPRLAGPEAQQKAAVTSATRAVIALRRKEEFQKITTTLSGLLGKSIAGKKAEDIAAVMEFILAEPRIPELFAMGSQTIRPVMLSKAREFLTHPRATEALRSLCQKVIDKYGPKTRTEEFDCGVMERWAAAKDLVDPAEKRLAIAALIRWAYDFPERVTAEMSPVVLGVLRTLTTSVTEEYPPSHCLVCKALAEELVKA